MSPEQRRAAVDAASRRVLERHWVAIGGFTMPNRRKYPWQWLWDSCFHAVAWSALADPRCSRELESVFSSQLPSGFVPHMGYQTHPEGSLPLWHAAGRSDITQPPMYGHALRVLASRGFAVDHLHDSATAGLRYLLEHRRDPGTGLIRVLHPWETGCDDSPRWDGWDSRPFKERRWNAFKRELVRSIRLSDGAAWENPNFDVASAGFSALVAFNARELGELTGDGYLLSAASALADAIDARWAEPQRTWTDARLRGSGTGASVRTLDALFPVLVSGNARYLEAGFAELFDPRSFWRPRGPSGTAADEASYDPAGYWRGDAWPQEIYLMMIAAERRGYHQGAHRLAEQLVLGCVAGGYAERWNPETGGGLGAIPQSWAALASEGVRVLEAGGAPDGHR
jgi:hypothetical protein